MCNKTINMLFLYVFSFQCSYILPTQVTSHNRWAICSPSTNQIEPLSKQPVQHGSYEKLKELGQKAHQSWQKEATPTNVVENLNTIFAPVNHAFLITLIDEILASDQLLEEIEKASYKNITGFLKLVLASGGKDSWKLRLHIWEQKEKEFPHNHK